MKEHKTDCDCYGCKYGMKALIEFEQQAIEKYGWFSHAVFDDDRCPNGINFHTHAIKEVFGHTDFQLCIPVPARVFSGLMFTIVEEIKKGTEFMPGVEYKDIAQGGFIIKFIMAKECGRAVLRMILPDVDGTYKKRMYAAQFEQLDNQ